MRHNGPQVKIAPGRLPFNPALNISAEANLTETCFYFHKKVRLPLHAALSKWPPSQIICPPLIYCV